MGGNGVVGGRGGECGCGGGGRTDHIYDNCPINISIGSDLGTSLVYVSILLISDPYISPLVSWVCTYTS